MSKRGASWEGRLYIKTAGWCDTYHISTDITTGVSGLISTPICPSRKSIISKSLSSNRIRIHRSSNFVNSHNP